MFDFSAYITEHTRDFTGRDWVFAEIDRWLADPDAPCYFIVTGEPGIGKTAIAARLTQIRDLAAFHFCIARQADTIDPLLFARSLSQQLCRIDGFVHGILKEGNVQVEARQTIGEVSGQAINVKIENLILDAPSAVTAFTHTVVEPLKALYAKGYPGQLVLLVDALDETVQLRGLETIVDLLANARNLPFQVRFLLTSRPEGAALRHFERLRIPYLVLDAGREENQRDVRTYIRCKLDNSPALQGRLAEQGMPAETFVQRVTTASRGNFLYLVWLLRAIEEGIQGFEALETLPQGLDGIYREFLRTRAMGQDIGRWRERYRPILGALAAAQEPLTAEQLAGFTGLSEQEVDDLLLDVEQFLDPIRAESRLYQLYHQSVIDFLSTKEQAQEFWIDFVPIHSQIADYYWSTYHQDWQHCHHYGLKHLAYHLTAGQRISDLYALVESQTWVAAKYVDTPWVGSLMQDLQLASTIAAGGKVEDWARSMGYQLCRAQIEKLMSRVSQRAILLLAKLGRVDQALDFAKRHYWNRFNLIREIARIVASTQPAKAIDILVNELERLADSESTLNQCKVKIAMAKEILRTIPSFSHEAYRLIVEVHKLETTIAGFDLITYQIEWGLPVLALSGELETAIEKSSNLNPVQQAQALRNMSIALPDEDRLNKQRLAELALNTLMRLEPSPESVQEKMRTMVTLLPLVDSDRQEELLDSLESAGNYLESRGEPRGYDQTQAWVIDRVAKVNLGWAKHMLYKAEWQGTQYNNGRDIVLEIAKADTEEALQLFKDRFAVWAGSSQTLADIIGTVALNDTIKAEALIDEYSEQLRGDEQEAYLALADGYLAQGDYRTAQKIFDQQVLGTKKYEGLVHAREALQLAILNQVAELNQASPFLSVEDIRNRLMQFPTCPYCHQSKEQEAKHVLACIAARQGRTDFLEGHHFSLKTEVAAAYNLVDHVGLQAAKQYLGSRYILPHSSEEGRKIHNYIAAVEAQQDTAKLEVLLEHFSRDGQPHHFCDHMTALPFALRKLVEAKRIASSEAKAIIERVYPTLVEWQRPDGDNPPRRNLVGGRCFCYARRDQVLAQLIGLMAQFDIHHAEQMVESLSNQPVKVYALAQILHQTQTDIARVHSIIEASQKCIEDPWQRAEVFYNLATSLPTEMSDAIGHLVQLAEPLLEELPTQYYSDEFGDPIRIGPSQVELKICKAQALMRLVSNLNQFTTVTESLEVIKELALLGDKLRVFDILTQQVDEWSRDDKLALLWRIWESSISKALVDVQTFIAFSLSIVKSIGGESAFWRLYDCVEWAYQGLPQVDQNQADAG
jgi:hypothetical protein